MIFTWLLYVLGEVLVQGLLFRYKKGYGHVPGDQFYIVWFIAISLVWLYKLGYVY